MAMGEGGDGRKVSRRLTGQCVFHHPSLDAPRPTPPTSLIRSQNEKLCGKTPPKIRRRPTHRSTAHHSRDSSISNTLVGNDPVRTQTVEARLFKLENDMGEIKRELCELKRNKRSRHSRSTSPLLTPVPKRPRTVQETPIMRSSLMVSTPERDALAHWVSNDLQQSLREGQRRHLNRERVAPGPSRRGKLKRRVHELGDM
ncbi:hypothetical protein B0H16DRAFT_1694973 [Mycena metata]|uniref:Uncharacterized protein n=1 Tax=Mycena metata TaxID=1033252 RepID=A0AAD7MYT4_9AGAR|nr:hypothetical protein B0H16DRAFT_1694973 [Mycena metata]